MIAQALFWLAIFLAAAAAETAFLPPLLGGTVPLMTAVAVSGTVFLSFWPAFLYALLIGFFQDALGPADSASNVLILLVSFISVRAFLKWSEWDDPLKSISALFWGFLWYPAGWAIALFLERQVFGAAAYGGKSAIWPFAAEQGLFFALWALGAGAFLVRRFKKLRAQTLAHL